MPDECEFTSGVRQDADGTITHHLHPPGEAVLGYGVMGQEYGAPCILCARGVPLLPPLRRVVRDGWVQYIDPTGETISAPVRLVGRD